MDQCDEKTSYQLLEYRLSQIEMTVKAMKATLDSFTQQMALFQGYDSRLTSVEQQIDKLVQQMVCLEDAPYKNSAHKWDEVANWVFKAIVLACIGLILAKVGLK